MITLLLNLILAILWMAMWGSFDAATLVAGLIVGYLVIAMITHRYGRKLWLDLAFAVYFLRILIIANWQVAKVVLNPRMPIAPRLIRYDVSNMTPVQIATLVNCITLTPGTLVVDISPDNRWLYIHCLTAADRAQAIRELDELRDHLLREVFE